MALKNLFGKGKKPAVKVRPDSMDRFFYHYNNGKNIAWIDVDQSYSEEFLRGSMRDGCRVIVYIDPAKLQEDGIPQPEELQKVRQLEQELTEHLSQSGVVAKLVGSMLYGGMMDILYMVGSLSEFQSALGSWKKKQKEYRIEEANVVGWNFYEEKLLPKGVHLDQLSDGRLIEQLRAAGTNMQAGHWIQYHAFGPAGKLQKVQEAAFLQDFYPESLEGDHLVMEKCCKLELQEVFSNSVLFRLVCEQQGVKYDGWEAAVLSDRVISGSIQDGIGEKLWAVGQHFKGEWRGGLRHGRGKLKFDDNSWYEGDFFQNKRTGEGYMRWAHNEYYEGGFLDGNLHGKGTYEWPSGNKYTGDWFHGERTGKGQFWWANGDSYTGDFTGNQRTGKGRYDWNNGDWYEGDFVAGKLHGVGKEYLFAKNEFIEGAYQNGTCVSEYKRYPGPAREGSGAPASGSTPSNSSGGFAPGKPPAPESPSKSKASAPKKIRSSDLSWTMLDPMEAEMDEKISREARFAAAKGLRSFIFYRTIMAPGHTDLRALVMDEAFAAVFEKVHIIQAGADAGIKLQAQGFRLDRDPHLIALNPNGSDAERPFEGALDGSDLTVLAEVLRAYFYG